MFRVIDRDRTLHGDFEARDQADARLAALFENDLGAPDGFYWIGDDRRGQRNQRREIDDTTSKRRRVAVWAIS